MSDIIFFSDFHAHIFEDFAKPDPEYPNDRFRAQMETLQKVFDIARQRKGVVVFAGDLFHKRGKIDDVVFNNVFKIFAGNVDIPTWIIRGNHDSRQNTTVTEHWLETFKYLEHVCVIDVPEIKYGEHNGTEFFIYGVPYSDDTEYLKKKIVEFAEHKKNRPEIPGILVGHIGVDGSETGKYNHRLEGAFKLGDLFPDVFDYVALGHYHKRQFLGGRKNAFYIGNTIQTSFSDEGQAKGVMVVDLKDKGDPKFIEIPNKQFITLTDIDENTQEIVDNNYVRFILPEDKAQEVEVFKEESDNVRVEIKREFKTETRIDIDVDSDEKQIVEAYTKEFYPEITDLCIDILKEAMAT